MLISSCRCASAWYSTDNFAFTARNFFFSVIVPITGTFFDEPQFLLPPPRQPMCGRRLCSLCAMKEGRHGGYCQPETIQEAKRTRAGGSASRHQPGAIRP